ncbi:MAG: aspartate kinase, partial [Dokdonella sp.]
MNPDLSSDSTSPVADPANRADASPRPWVVVKFGGSSVSARERWDAIAGIVSAHREAGRRVLIVVSALGGVTDQLKAISELTDRREQARAIGSEVVARHRLLAEQMDLADTTAIDERLDQLLRHVEVTGDELGTYAWQAELLAHGELLSSALGAAYLASRGIQARWLDSRNILQADVLPNQNEWSRWMCAVLPVARNAALAETLIQQGEVFIAQGFIAADDAGRTVVLGRGGSDTSAAYLGALLAAERVEIWTDVPGLFSANPRQVSDARLLARLDYAEAQEIATTGAKVLHPRCIHPVRECRIPLLIRDTHHPHLPGTMISADATQTAPSVKAISSRRGITLVSMETIGMWQQVGFLSDVFDVFRRHGLSVDLIGSAETNVTVSLDPSDNLLTTDVLARLCEALAPLCRVKVIAPCAAVTLVGRGMRSMLHKLSGVLAEFGALDVHLISQSSNNLNLTFVVDESLADA